MTRARCADCGNEVETDDLLGNGTESYQCTKCGTYGTLVRKSKKPIFIQFGKDDSTAISVASAMVLPNFAETHVKCQHCGNYVSSFTSICTFCKQALI